MPELKVYLIAALFALAYWYLTHTFSYWKKKGVLFLKPYPIFGSVWNLIAMKEHTCDFFSRICRQNPNEKLIGYFQGGTPGLIITDPDLIKCIMIRDFVHFTDHGFRIEDPLHSRNLFNMVGDKWREMRHKLSPTFTSGKIKGMFPLVESCAENLNKFSKQHLRGHVDVKDLMARYTTDVIGSCAFGINANSIEDPNDKFREMGRKMLEVDFVQGMKNACIIFIPAVAKLLNLKFFTDEVCDFFRQLVKDIVASRIKEGNTRKDFMQLLVQLKLSGKVSVDDGDVATEEHQASSTTLLDDDDIVAQAVVFYFAGFETSSSTLTFALMELARAPNVQQKARENINDALKKHNGLMSYEALHEMNYLDWIVQETLRMYTPAPALTRKCVKKYTIPDTGITIDKGTLITVPANVMHSDPQYFDNPTEFRPERFGSSEIFDRKCVYMPFGDGPRQCIAMRFAKMQIKLALYSILRSFELSESSNTIYPPIWDPKQVLLASKNDIFVQFAKL